MNKPQFQSKREIAQNKPPRALQAKGGWVLADPTVSRRDGKITPTLVKWQFDGKKPVRGKSEPCGKRHGDGATNPECYRFHRSSEVLRLEEAVRRDKKNIETA